MANTNHEHQESTQDLLDHVEVVVACNTCDATYSVLASIVRESQRILAEGCSGSSLFECDAAFYATLIEPEAIETLERAWANFRQSASGHGALGVVLHAGERHASDRDDEPPDQDTRATRRWENEGGQCGHAHTEFGWRPREAHRLSLRDDAHCRA
jgi:hypothetical protein